jgi:7-cyano-7-deazaguanine synthase
MARALSLGLAHSLHIEAPYSGKSKAEVIRKGRELSVPFELTLSCMNPQSGLHCGTCSKCRERHDAFVEAGFGDPTAYVDQRFVGT